MHIFFSGIGGTAIGPLALIAKQAGYTVSGSDKQDSQYIDYLRKHGISNIHIGQLLTQIEERHRQESIDWFVYTSALPLENPNAPELLFCKDNNIKTSKRDELLNQIISDKGLRLIAIAGTHGKTTTTAMTIWLFQQLGLPVSYSVGAKIPFGDMGHYQEGSKYFIYECDEFDRNFLAFHPHVSLLTGVTWDHHEIFPTREDYQQAFRDFVAQSTNIIMWQEDADYLNINPSKEKFIKILDSSVIRNGFQQIKLAGLYNRLDAWLAMQAVGFVAHEPDMDKLSGLMGKFPGLQRRMEQIIPNLYSDYAHTPEKIRGAMSVALEMAEEKDQKLVVIYEPLTNRRQHYMLDDYGDCFAGANKLYWIPSYLAREDPAQRIIPPEELISHLPDQSFVEAMKRDSDLKQTIHKHLNNGDMVVCMAGGGGDSLDEWIRREFKI